VTSPRRCRPPIGSRARLADPTPTVPARASALAAGFFHAGIRASKELGTAFIPAVGAGAVCLGVALLVFLPGHPYAAFFLAVWGLTVVRLVDNPVKPLLSKAGMQMNGAVVFFSLIGGLAAFGGVGLPLRPLILTLLLALLTTSWRAR
jgi:predicted PurR-regulated permease PerM